MQKVASLLLTAGSSSRMGKPKALLPWGPISVVRHILNQIERVGLHNVLLVTGAHHQEILKEVQDSHTRICYHPQWELGMGSSIVAGVAAIEREFPETESILILLVDQPFLSSAYLQKILSMHGENSKALIASDYGPFAGVPALFPKKFWEDLKQIPPGRGAKPLITQFRKQCIMMDPGEVIIDIDTPEAYVNALKLAGLSKT